GHGDVKWRPRDGRRTCPWRHCDGGQRPRRDRPSLWGRRQSSLRGDALPSGHRSRAALGVCPRNGFDNRDGDKGSMCVAQDRRVHAGQDGSIPSKPLAGRDSVGLLGLARTVQPLRTRVREVSPEAPALEAVAEAAAVLAGKGLVGFPTESYYGLGADARQASAVRRVFEVKGRSGSKPLLLLVDSLAMLESLVETIPSQARALMERYWPGPLTIVLRARPTASSAVTAGPGTVGIRIPG